LFNPDSFLFLSQDLLNWSSVLNTLYIAFRVLVYNKFCTNARQVPLLEQELLPFRSTSSKQKRLSQFGFNLHYYTEKKIFKMIPLHKCQFIKKKIIQVRLVSIAFRVLVYNKFCTNARQVPLLEQELLPFRSTEFTPVFSGVGLAPILVLFLSQDLLNWSSVLIYLIYCLVGEQEEFEDTKGIIRIH
jgi:hypothetical protein